MIENAKNGDSDARQFLVENNIGLIWNIAKKFYGRGVEPDDLFQIGSIGLLKSIDKFDPSFGVKFSTYAVPMILGEIKRFLRDDGAVKVSRSLKELNGKVLFVRESLTKELGREPTIREIAEHLGVEVEDIVQAADAMQTPTSLYAGEGEDSPVVIDGLASKQNVEDEVAHKVMIQNALSKFKSRERQIIIMRYFEEKSQTQIAKMLGISQVQVSRIEKKVLLEMRKYM
ncbi:MAG: SigB/SigF/SigG family RNA polymerase sigma factor [Clostridiales bacterium]|jgi:RNA polymerase sporulation-specific sigma factor|nr:SigB/SigF/SigG family RNA polymerase sigma factor [Clostridiales bacterium]